MSSARWCSGRDTGSGAPAHGGRPVPGSQTWSRKHVADCGPVPVATHNPGGPDGRDRTAQGRPCQGQAPADRAQIDDGTASRHALELFSTIKGELTLHEIVEEEIFYPELEAHPKAKDIVLEGYQEHHVVDVLMGELESLDVSDETWGPKALVMKENIEHHIEEEEGEMFTKARQVFDNDELDDLGRRMEERKLTAGREMGIRPSPPPTDRAGDRAPRC